MCHGSGLQAALGREEHAETDQLQAEPGSHGRLMRVGRIVSIGAGPPGDDETGEALQPERGAHVEDAQRGIGAAGDLLGEIPREDCEAQHRRRAGGSNDPEEQMRR